MTSRIEKESEPKEIKFSNTNTIKMSTKFDDFYLALGEHKRDVEKILGKYIELGYVPYKCETNFNNTETTFHFKKGKETKVLKTQFIIKENK